MNQRLVWNFEINSNPPLDFDSLPQDEKTEIKWEARYFWSNDTIISLTGLNERFLDLGNYEIKHRQDYYLLLPECDYNIKQRREELQYKPLLEHNDHIRGYGKKIDLTQYPAIDHLQAREIQEKAQKVAVPKIALIYKLQTVPTIKLELARLKVAEKAYFSVCIEGRSKLLVAQIAKHLLADQVSCDYVHFLKQILKS